MSWVDNKGAGPWPFTERGNVWGYLNNPRWSSQQDAIDFCENKDLPLDLPDQHLPCGHWHKEKVSETPFPSGRWVAAMQQPGTPYIYVYDILQKAVIQINTSEIPVFVSGRLELDSAYALDYDMGHGNPGSQRGAYCMNKDGTRIWYLFCDQGAYPVTRDHPDAQLIEVDISKTVMRVVKRTLFPNLLPAEAFPDSQAGRVNDGCSDDTHTYWCTQLIAGRIIKIRNSDHVIVDDHYFNYPLSGCGVGLHDEPITTIDAHKSTGKLYWVYVRDHTSCSPPYAACRHFIRSDTDLVQEIDDLICSSGAVCGTPLKQNMIRLYANILLHHRAYHPNFDGYLMRRNLDCIEEDEVEGTDGHRYACIKSHFAAVVNRPTTGADHLDYWVRSANSGGAIWSGGQSYTCNRVLQKFLQNIFGVKDGNIFTLMHPNSVDHPGYLHCINFSEMTELSNLDISYYTGQSGPAGPSYDWDWTSVSAMNYQTGVIAIFRYHNVEERNYVGCFNANSNLGLLCDVPLTSVKSGDQERSDEPQIWTMPDDDAPVPADPDAGGGEGGPPGGTACVGQTPKLSPSFLSISIMEGTDPINHSIRITDNCGNSLAFQVEEINNNNWITWINSPVVGNSGVGILNINFNTVSMSAGSYAGSIVISTNLGNLTLNINLVVTSSPDYGEATGITLIAGDTYRRFDFRAGEVKLFKFKANSGPVLPQLAIVAEVMSHYSHGYLHLMARYAGQNWETAPPNDSDYAAIKAIIATDLWAFKGIHGDIYYYISAHLTKRIYINLNPEVTNGCFYFWIKNYGSRKLNDCMVHFRVRG